MSAFSSDVEGRAGGRRRFQKQMMKRRQRRRARLPTTPPAMAVDFEQEELELELGV